jgi:hypothetical protein
MEGDRLAPSSSYGRLVKLAAPVSQETHETLGRPAMLNPRVSQWLLKTCYIQPKPHTLHGHNHLAQHLSGGGCKGIACTCFRL